MKRYLVFAGEQYDSYGGIDDCFGDFDEYDEAEYKAIELGKRYWWSNVFDQQDVTIVFRMDFYEYPNNLNNPVTKTVQEMPIQLKHEREDITSS